MKPTTDRAATYVPAFTLAPDEARRRGPRAADGRSTPNFINDIAAGKVELPTIPRVVQQLIAALRDPDVDTRKIGEALSQDPVLSAKVLRLANSSFFGGQRSMASIDAAVALIGIQALNRLIVACGVSSSFRRDPGHRPAYLLARRADRRDRRQQARAAPRRRAEEAYVCGLLHATGHLILCQTYPDIANVHVRRLRVGARRRARGDRDRVVRHRPPDGRRALGRDDRLSAAGRRHDPQVARSRSPPSDAPLDLALRSACAAGRGGGAEERRRDGAGGAAADACARSFAGADGSPTPPSPSSTRRCRRPSRRSERRAPPRSGLRRVGNDVVLLGRVVARDDRARRLGRAEVDRLVRHARRDEEEVAGLADHRRPQAVAVARLDPAFEDVDRRSRSRGARADRRVRPAGSRPCASRAPRADGRAGNADKVGQALLGQDLGRGPDCPHFARRALLPCELLPFRRPAILRRRSLALQVVAAEVEPVPDRARSRAR